jgi:hypothetical protein
MVDDKNPAPAAAGELAAEPSSQGSAAATVGAAPKRKYKKRRKVRGTRKTAARPAVAPNITQKPPLPPLDPLEQAQEAARLAQEGSYKLSKAVDVLRATLETIVQAEVDRKTGLRVNTQDLRGIAVSGLDEYSVISGQNWRRSKLLGNWAGGTGNTPVHERDMKTQEY